MSIGPIKKNALRKATGNKPDKDMPEADKQIKKGDSAHVRKMKQFALNAKKFNHKGKKPASKKK